MIACVCLCVFISNAFLQTNFISSLLAGYCGLWRNSDCLHVDLLMNFCFIVAQHVLLTLTQFLDTNLHLSFVISGYIPLYLFSFFLFELIGLQTFGTFESFRTKVNGCYMPNTACVSVT